MACPDGTLIVTVASNEKLDLLLNWVGALDSLGLQCYLVGATDEHLAWDLIGRQIPVSAAGGGGWWVWLGWRVGWVWISCAIEGYGRAVWINNTTTTNHNKANPPLSHTHTHTHTHTQPYAQAFLMYHRDQVAPDIDAAAWSDMQQAQHQRVGLARALLHYDHLNLIVLSDCDGVWLGDAVEFAKGQADADVLVGGSHLTPGTAVNDSALEVPSQRLVGALDTGVRGRVVGWLWF